MFGMRNEPSVGDTVICYRVDGCMANVKVFQWVGRIVKKQYVLCHGAPNDRAPGIIIEKDFDPEVGPYDSRDRPVRSTYTPLGQHLQKIRKGFWFYYV